MSNNLNLYQQVIHLTRYARYNDEEQRRETWDETVRRYTDHFKKFLDEKYDYSIENKLEKDIFNSIFRMDVMPSMRTLMTSGQALEKVQVANYNCSFTPVDTIRSFSEHMYVLMCGTGSGFSVEYKFINQLPEIPEELHPTETTIKISDSRKGWCVAFNQFLNLLYSGNIPEVDTSKLRPEGARLKTFGGYSSGPKVLEDLFTHTISVFQGAKGRKLKPIEVFSLMTYIAQIVVVGGVRRSATIALFDKNDFEMRTCKSGEWWVQNPHFAMANISAAFENKPSVPEFLDFWKDLILSYSGEPGIYNRQAVWKQCEKFGRKVFEENGERIQFGTNPCGEIILKPNQFCNLTGVAIRPEDDLKTLKNKVELATILGTFQSAITDFDYLRKSWKKTVEEERLLGVCLAGIMDHPVLSQVSHESARWLTEMRELVWKVNKKWSKKLNINSSTSVTSIKPAGNSGELYDVSSGIHPRFSEYYIRRIRQTGTAPITKFLKDQGIPFETSVQNDRDVVFSFYVKSPKHAVTAKTMTALDQLEHWLHYKKYWATHTISCTIYVRDHEWMDVASWVYEHFDDVIGLSFLPYSDNTYKQAPFETITEDKYIEGVKNSPSEIDFSALIDYEKQDNTATSQEFACVGGACTI